LSASADAISGSYSALIIYREISIDGKTTKNRCQFSFTIE
jgi:hypothetical protein